MQLSNNRKAKFGATKTKNIFRRTHGRCSYCGIHMLPPKDDKTLPKSEVDKHFTLDHLLPKSKGGNDSEANLLGVCKGCNNKRGNAPLDFLRMKLLFPKKGWPKFNQIQFEFLLSKGVNLGTIEEFKFYYERIGLK